MSLSMKTFSLPPHVTQVDGRNVGDENVNVELDGARHDAGGLSPMGLDCSRTSNGKVHPIKLEKTYDERLRTGSLALLLESLWMLLSA